MDNYPKDFWFNMAKSICTVEFPKLRETESLIEDDITVEDELDYQLTDEQLLENNELP